jgi:hypothetical protein
MLDNLKKVKTFKHLQIDGIQQYLLRSFLYMHVGFVCKKKPKPRKNILKYLQ